MPKAGRSAFPGCADSRPEPDVKMGDEPKGGKPAGSVDWKNKGNTGSAVNWKGEADSRPN